MIFRIFGIIILLAILWAIVGVYNNLVSLRSRVDDALRRIYTLLRRRKDLVPDLLVIAKSLDIDEWDAVEDVAFAHGIAVAADTPAQAMQADADLARALDNLFEITEKNPSVASSENFTRLKDLFKKSNRELENACKEYDECVLAYNSGIQKFPSRIFAGVFQFKEHEGLDALMAASE